MTSTLSTLAEFIMVDTRLASGAVWLPLASSSQGRRITIKDAYGTFGNSTCQIAASNDDLFDDSTSFKLISTNFASLSFVAVGSRWYGLSSNVFNTGTNFSSLTINLPSSIYQMDVNGIANFSTLTIRTSTVGSLFGSTVNALGSMGYVSSASLQSTVAGLGNAGYISSGSLQSTVVGLGIVTGFVSSPNLQSTVVGLGSYGYISSASLQSTVAGLGNASYISSLSLQSTMAGLGNSGYISSASLQSTVVGLGIVTGFISSPNLQSTVIGLGSYGYISSASLQSTVQSTVTGLPVMYPALTGGGTTNLQALTVSTGTLFASSMSFVNINTSSMNMWVAVGAGTSNLRFKYSLNGSNWISPNNSNIVGYGVAWNGNIWVAVGFDTTSNNTIIYSSDGISWNQAQGFLFQPSGGSANAGGYDVAWNGRMWVAVGKDNIVGSNIRYSSNGTTWFNANQTFSTAGYGVAWNGSIWVATGVGAGVNPTLKYSFDGINWSDSVSGGFSSVLGQNTGYGVAWNGRMWVAVGQDSPDANTIKYSFDGSNWNNSLGIGFEGNGRKVAWNGRMWVAVGNAPTSSNNTIKYSYDGINWSNSLGTGFVTGGSNIVWNGNFWIAVGGDNINNRIQTSSNGINWTPAGPGDSGNINGIAFSSNVIAAYSQSNLQILPQNIPIFLTSTNTIMNQPSSMIINNTLIIDGTWDRVGINCNIPQYSLDVNGSVNLSTLSIQSTPVQIILGSTVIGLGAYGYVSSLNLQSTVIGLGTYNYISSLQLFSTVSGLSNTYPVLAGGGGGTLSALDNVSAFTVSTGFLLASRTPNVNVIPSSMVMWVAVGDDTTPAARIKYSQNAQFWTNALGDTFSGMGRGVAFNGRMWVAVGSGGSGNSNATIKTSSNGINWTNVTSGGFTDQGRGVAWNGSYWVAVGSDITQNARLKWSSNGTQWFDSLGTGFTSQGIAVAWNGRFWVSVGQGTGAETIKWSLNGSNWSNSISGAFANAARGVAWNGRMWVAVGQDTTPAARIKYSFDGSNWLNSVSGTFSVEGRGIAWNGRMWVAVGQDAVSNNSFKYSYDGMNWSNSVGDGFDDTSTTNNTWGIAWGGFSTWVATGFDNIGATNNNIKFSFDGVTWNNSSGSGFSSNGNGVAYASNTTPAYSQANLLILPENIPLFYRQNTIFAQPSSMILNETVTIDAHWDRVGINCNIPQYALDVFGDVNVSTLSIQSTPFQNILGSTVVGLGRIGYVSTQNLQSSIFNLGTTGYVSTLSLQSTIAGLGRFYPSTLSLQSTVSGLSTIYPILVSGRQTNLLAISTGGMNASTILINTNISTIFRLDVNGPARTMMPISSLCNTSANVGLTGHGIFYYITNSGFNGITLPPTDPIGGWFVSLRNNTGTTLSVTISGTNAKIPASPFSISPANTVTLAYDAVPPTGGCNWVYF